MTHRNDEPDRRRVQRGGRRASDLTALSPDLQIEASEYAAEIARCLSNLDVALGSGDLISAREASKAIQRAAHALHLLLRTGKTAKD